MADADTGMDADTDNFKIHFYIYTTLIFIPNVVVVTAVFTSKPCR